MKDKSKEEEYSIISSSKKKRIQINSNKNTSKKLSSSNNDKEIKIGNYLIKKTLGRGNFGKVKLGIYLPKNRKVAIKILEKNKLKEKFDITRLKREFEMIIQFNHPNAPFQKFLKIKKLILQ